MRGDRRVLERLVRHDVAPVARGVADREQHRHVPPPASANASGDHGHQSTGFSACCSRYGEVASASRLVTPRPYAGGSPGTASAGRRRARRRRASARPRGGRSAAESATAVAPPAPVSGPSASSNDAGTLRICLFIDLIRKTSAMPSSTMISSAIGAALPHSGP